MGNWKGRFFCLDSLLKSVDFEHFLVNHDWVPKVGIWERRFFCLNSFLKSVDFEHFWVNHDWVPKIKFESSRNLYKKSQFGEPTAISRLHLMMAFLNHLFCFFLNVLFS